MSLASCFLFIVFSGLLLSAGRCVGTPQLNKLMSRHETNTETNML